MRAIVLIAFSILLSPVVAHADEAQTRRALEIIQTRLEPQHRDRVLRLWSETREKPGERQKLIEALEQFDTKMKPDWTGLGIAGATTGVAAGIGAGVLAAKLGAAGMVAGPIGAVVGVGMGALIGYSIHKYHQRKALSGGVFSRTGRRMGFKGKGLEGDLLRIEDELKKAAAPAAPEAPRRRWTDRFRRTRPSPTPSATAPAAPRAQVPVAPAVTSPGDDPNADDVHRSDR